MNKKIIYIIIIVACTLTVGIVWNMMKQAEDAKNMSDDLMQQFKAVDESLQKKSDSMRRADDKANDSISIEMERSFDSGKTSTP
ncbi:MAG: hypothetical protein V4685_08615 [Bacteroidota bacterium]